jgi:membrane protein implicated in regulation of membrane protease activity
MADSAKASIKEADEIVAPAVFFYISGVLAWLAGTVAYHAASGLGSTLASFTAAMLVYVALERWSTRTGS